MTINKTKPSDPTVNGDSLSFGLDIAAEFGQGDYSLGQYRRDDPRFTNKNAGELTNLPLDTGIPNNGEIKFSDFYGKKLNIVVNYYNGNQETVDDDGRATLTATHRYVNEPTSNPLKVVGGFAQAPDATVTGANNDYKLTSTKWRDGRKIIVHVNKEIGGKLNGDRDSVSLRTGRWPTGTTLQVDVGSSGKIYGAGGKGGGGGATNGTSGLSGGFTGMSALGIEYAATINNNGLIRCGYGGGGGGSGSANDPSDKSDEDYGRSGGGGGGGAGLPAGKGGQGNLAGFQEYDSSDGLPFNQRGQPGFDGSLDNGGGGGGAGNQGGADAGEGGDGGDFELAASPGVKGTQDRPNVGYTPPVDPGAAGIDGKAIYYRTQTIRNNSILTGNSVGGRNGGQAVSIDIN